MAVAVLTLLGTGFLPILGWKFEWVTAHWIAGLVLAALVAWHILRAFIWLNFWSMVVDYEDVRNGWRAIGRAFSGKGLPPHKPGKYSPLQKLYHVAVACVVLALVATGVLMLLKIDTPLWRRNPYWFSDHAWGVIYSIHDLCAMSVITLLMAHVYFALRREKLWMSWSMISGWISQADYRTHHDPARWSQEQGGE
jgi:cytochrome b subunit of formate dehydrogenase